VNAGRTSRPESRGQPFGDHNVIAGRRPGPGLDIALAWRSLDEGANRLAVGGRVPEVQRQASVLEPAAAERAERKWRELIHVDAACHGPAAEAECRGGRVVMNAAGNPGGEVTWRAHWSCEHVDRHQSLP
jgi:hypothetical protein